MKSGVGSASRRISGLVRMSREWCLAVLPWVVGLATVFIAGWGRLNYDTKYMLHVDAHELMSLSRHVWDPMQYGGYVAHQAIGYLWPAGPFHAAGQLLGMTPWVMQRLWLALVFGAAGAGVVAWLRSRGHSPLSVAVAALLYQLSPFVLAYQARTSLMLLPWASLGWLAMVTSRGVRQPRWRDSAIAALLLGTAGGINATALILVIPALALIVFDEIASRRAGWRATFVFCGRSAVLGVLLSLWWMAPVVLQGRYGSRVLFFSETLEDVSLPATAFEVLRGFGYWLNYVGLDGSPVTSAAASSLGSPLSVAATLVFPLAAMIGVLVGTRAARRLAVGLVATGLLLAVNVHPITDPPRLWSAVASSPDSWLALAFRSSTRATPVLLLGASLGVASLLDSPLARRQWCLLLARVRVGAVIALVCLLGIMIGVPARFTDGVADTTLSRGTNLPRSWSALGQELQASLTANQRVLQLPGQEFAKYDWGYTGESALLAAQDRPVLIRELLPLGDEQFMNLLGAVNDAALEGRLDQSKVNDLSRLMGVGAVVIPSDLDDRFYGTPDQETLLAFNGLDPSLSVAGHRILAVPGSRGVMRTQTGHAVVFGDGYGLVAAAGWDVLGERTIRYAADLTDDDLRSTVASAEAVVITDSNRVRAHHWRATRDSYGFSEDGTETTRLLRSDPGDRRLAVFTDLRQEDATLVQQRGPVTVRATRYGSSLRLQPESRPFSAIDGSLGTAWSAGADEAGMPVLTLTAESDVSSMRLVQQQTPSKHRIAAVTVTLDGGPPERLRLDETSMSPAGQVIPLGRGGRIVRIKVSELMPTTGTAQRDTIGFAEIDLGLGPTVEVGVLPTRGTASIGADRPLSYVFSRDRAPEWDPARSDPETRVLREFVVPAERSFDVRASVGRHETAAPPETLSITVDGRTVTLAAAGDGASGRYVGRSPLVLGPGVHLIDTISSTALVDEVVLTSVPARGANADTSVMVGTSSPSKLTWNGSPTERSAVLDSCENGCWLIFGESYNRGWTLEVGGTDRGAPMRVDGGVNGWLLDPVPNGTALTLRFGPQRIADIAQVLSLGGAILCLVVIVASRRRRGVVAGAPSPVTYGVSTAETVTHHPRSGRSKLSAGGIRVLTCAALGFLLLPDRWTLVIVAVSAVSILRDDSPEVHVRAGIAGVIASLLVGLLLIVRVPPPNNFLWTLTADRVHSAIMASILLMLVGVTIDARGREKCDDPKDGET